MSVIKVQVVVENTGDPEALETIKGDLELAGWGAPVEVSGGIGGLQGYPRLWHHCLEYHLEVDEDA